jgi:hypothetical protein
VISLTATFQQQIHVLILTRQFPAVVRLAALVMELNCESVNVPVELKVWLCVAELTQYIMGTTLIHISQQKLHVNHHTHLDNVLVEIMVIVIFMNSALLLLSNV